MTLSAAIVGPAAGPRVTTGPARVIRYGAVDSTNQVARDLLRRSTVPSWTVIIAESQRAGRGRRGRVWESPPGNLYSSVIVYPDVAATVRPQLSLIAGLAVAGIGEAMLPGCPISLKWPNDVLATGLKLAGILLETDTAPDGSTAVIIGTGINVAHAPAGTRYGATFLDALAPAPVTIERCLDGYLNALTAWYDVWMRDGFEPVRDAWMQRAEGLGRMVDVDTGAGIRRGTFIGLSPDGQMLLRGADGRRHAIAAGSVMPVERGRD